MCRPLVKTPDRLLHPHVNPLLKNGGTFTTTTKAMADVHLPATRSYNMSRIKSKNTQPEMLVRRFLHARSFRYLLHAKKLTGKPDIILPKYRTVMFVHGCFWHGHARCKYYVAPKTRTDWWLQKINNNIANYHKVIAALQQLGYNVITIWDCQLKPAVIETH